MYFHLQILSSFYEYIIKYFRHYLKDNTVNTSVPSP